MNTNTIVQSSRVRNRVINSVKLFLSGKSAIGRPKQVLMIMGCQRSGTTLLSSLFDEIYYTRVFEERSLFSLKDKYGYRLDDPEQVRRQLLKLRAPLVVLKPLVESQKALYWLDQITNMKVIWLYRDYLDTAASLWKKFGALEGSINNIRPFIDIDFAIQDWATWKSENASDRTKDIIRKYYSEDMSPADAGVLFWYARNVLFFEQHLDLHPDVMLLKYEEFVRCPKIIMQRLFNECNLPPRKLNSISMVDSSSVRKGKELQVSKPILSLADSLLGQLDQAFLNTQNPLSKQHI